MSWFSDIRQWLGASEQPGDNMDVVEQTATPTANADTFEAHKALRNQKEPPADAEKPVVEATPAEKPPKIDPPAPAEGESEEESGASETQETAGEPKPGKKSYEKRIGELTYKHREEERRRRALEKELEELRAGQPASASPATAPKEPAKVAAAPKPKPEEFETYEQYMDAVVDYRVNSAIQTDREARKAEQVREKADQQAADAKKSLDERLRDVRRAHADFDDVIAADPEAGTGLLLHEFTIQTLLQSPDGLELSYNIAKNPEFVERLRKFGNNPAQQIIEIGKIAHLVESAANGNGNGHHQPAAAVAPPEAAKPVVSRAPKPPTPVGGSEPPPAKSTADATSMEEHKRLRRAAQMRQ